MPHYAEQNHLVFNQYKVLKQIVAPSWVKKTSQAIKLSNSVEASKLLCQITIKSVQYSFVFVFCPRST